MDRARLYSLLLPPGISLLVHLALLAAIAIVSFTAVQLAIPDDPATDIVIALENPADTHEAPPDHAGPVSATSALAPDPFQADAPEAALAAPPIVMTPAIAAPPAAASAPSVDMRRAVAPGAAFAGLSAARVRRIVYVVDISGPMASSLPFVLEEVRRSVSRLDPSQYFQVVLFRDDIDTPDDPGAIVLTPSHATPTLLRATPANRASLAAFLTDLRPGGRSNPLAGLRAALAFHPDVIFLLAQGISRTGPNARWGEGNSVILEQLDRLNPSNPRGRRRTAIKTIQFIEDDPTGLMQTIARVHGQSPDSYTRRNVEDLQAARSPTASVQLLEPPDPSVDRAAALLWDLSASRLDLRAIFGLAAPEEITAVRRASAQALESVGNADQSDTRDELARLVLARALLLRAATEAANRGPLLDRSLAALDTSLGAPPEILATAALARALRMSAGDPDEAEALASRAVEIEPSTQAALEARLAAVLARAGNPDRLAPWLADLDAAMSRPPFIAGGRFDASLALLTLNASAAAQLLHANTPGAFDTALARHIAWYRAPRPGLPADAVLVAAGALLPPEAPLDLIAPELALARGLATLPPSGTPPAPDCLRALDIAATRAPAGSPIAEAASIRAAMAVSLWASSLPPDSPDSRAVLSSAVSRLNRALDEFPGRAWRRDAALHLIAHTALLLDLGAQQSAVAAPRRRALGVLLLEDPRPESRADLWRLELAQRTAEAESGDGSLEDAALAILDGPWIQRPAADIDRLSAWILSRRVARLTESLESAQLADNTPAARSVAESIAAAARRAIPFADRVSTQAADALRADLAESLIVQQSPEASEIYAALRARGVTLGRSEFFVTLAHARALLAQGDTPGAFAILRDLTASMPPPDPDAAPPTEDPDTFWHAWSLTLQVLAQRAASIQDDQARRTASAHLLRLQDLDPALGGEPWRSRLESTALSIGLLLEAPDSVHSGPP